MNLDKVNVGRTDAPLAPPEWTMELKREGYQVTAKVNQAGVTRCSIVAFGTPSDEAKVSRELADKARWWIHEYLGRNPESYLRSDQAA